MSATNAVVRIVPAAEGRLSPRTVRLGPDGGTVAWVNPEVVFHRVISDDGAPVTFDVSVAAGFESKAVAFPPGDYTASSGRGVRRRGRKLCALFSHAAVLDPALEAEVLEDGGVNLGGSGVGEGRAAPLRGLLEGDRGPPGGVVSHDGSSLDHLGEPQLDEAAAVVFRLLRVVVDPLGLLHDGQVAEHDGVLRLRRLPGVGG